MNCAFPAKLNFIFLSWGMNISDTSGRFIVKNINHRLVISIAELHSSFVPIFAAQRHCAVGQYDEVIEDMPAGLDFDERVATG